MERKVNRRGLIGMGLGLVPEVLPSAGVVASARLTVVRYNSRVKRGMDPRRAFLLSGSEGLLGTTVPLLGGGCNTTRERKTYTQEGKHLFLTKKGQSATLHENSGGSLKITLENASGHPRLCTDLPVYTKRGVAPGSRNNIDACWETMKCGLELEADGQSRNDKVDLLINAPIDVCYFLSANCSGVTLIHGALEVDEETFIPAVVIEYDSDLWSE